MFGKRKPTLKEHGDQALLDLVFKVKDQWQLAQKTQKNVRGLDRTLEMESKLQQAKFEFLFRQARWRKVAGEVVSKEVANRNIFR